MTSAGGRCRWRSLQRERGLRARAPGLGPPRCPPHPLAASHLLCHFPCERHHATRPPQTSQYLCPPPPPPPWLRDTDAARSEAGRGHQDIPVVWGQGAARASRPGPRAPWPEGVLVRGGVRGAPRAGPGKAQAPVKGGGAAREGTEARRPRPVSRQQGPHCLSGPPGTPESREEAKKARPHRRQEGCWPAQPPPRARRSHGDPRGEVGAYYVSSPGPETARARARCSGHWTKSHREQQGAPRREPRGGSKP